MTGKFMKDNQHSMTVDQAIRYCIQDGRTFSADTVKFLCQGQPSEDVRKALRKQVRQGIIRQIGYEPSFKILPNPEGGYPLTQARGPRHHFAIKGSDKKVPVTEPKVAVYQVIKTQGIKV